MAEHTPLRAAQYLRMSTEHQDRSLEHQALANAAYAAERGYRIVRTYEDAGISGVSLDGREGLKQLLADVVGGAADFDVVLVYDVSRWGRFQDPDESAHYEFLCRAAGVAIEYAAEPFQNDGSFAAAIAKQLKRAMAAEYSRELSDKISRAQRNLAAQGYWQGGPCGYGFRRLAIGPDGTPRRIMAPGEHKAVRGERTRLVAGPPEEVETVRRIFREFAVGGMNPAAIADMLNAERVPTEAGASWSAGRVRRLLRCERYAGILVTGRHRYRLHRRRRQSPGEWIRTPGGCPALIPERLFRTAQAQLRSHKPRVSDAALIDELRAVLRRHGRLSHDLVRDDPAAHCPDVYKRRFGDLMSAYRLAGFTPSEKQARAAAAARRDRPDLARRPPVVREDAELIAALRRVLAREGRLTVEIIAEAPDAPHPELYRRRFGGMRRVYALAGYAPSSHQERLMTARGGQSLDAAAAAALREASPAPQAGY